MDIINELLKIGFSEYEAKTYIALLSRNRLSASEVCQLAGVPKGRVYSILSSLMDKGMCIMLPGTVKRYRALPPDETFAMLCTQKRNEFEAQEKNTLKLSEHLLDIYDEEGNEGNDFDSVSIYTSIPNISKKSEYMIEHAQSIHRSLCKPPYITIQKTEELEAKSSPFFAASEKGTEFMAIYEIEKENFDNFNYICKFFHDRGEKVKVMEKLPLKLIIMDSKAAMFTMHHKSLKKNQITSMYVENSDIVFALTDLFDYYWSIATSYTDFVTNGYKLN